LVEFYFIEFFHEFKVLIVKLTPSHFDSSSQREKKVIAPTLKVASNPAGATSNQSILA
jgi:hypothetical protein